MKAWLPIWVRRGSGKVALPAMVVMTLVYVLGRDGWDWEWQRAVDWAAGSTILLGPATAGLVAFDLWRRVPSGLRAIMATSTRGSTAVLGPVVAAWLYAMIACAAGVTLAVVRTAAHRPDGSPSWWLLLEVPIALLASAAVGAAVGSVVRTVAAAPVAVVAAYLLPVAGGVVGLPDVLVAGGATGTLLGLTPDPAVVTTTLVVNLLIAASCLLVAVARVGPPRLGAVVAATSLGLSVVVAATGLWSLEPRLRGWDAVETRICVDGDIAVCGPVGGRALYLLAQRDLERSWNSLDDLGDPPAGGYEYAGATTRPGSGTGLLALGTVEGGRLDVWDVAVTIATPTACEQYFAEDPPTELLDGQARLAAWLAVGAADAAAGDPAELDLARQTYDALERCRPDAVPSWPEAP